jgi:hypothetical protein
MTPFRAAVSWLLLLTVAFLNGTLRQFAYPSTLDDFAARQVAVGVGAVALGVTMWFVLRRWPVSSVRQAWATGAAWAGLTIVFEIALVLGGGHPWSDVVDQYAIWRGSLWPLLVLWLLAAPAMISALQRSRVAVGPTLGWVVVGWAACGMVFALGRVLFGVEAAVIIHLLAAPLIGAMVTFLLWNHPRHPGVLATAATLAGGAALLDAILVAPFLERTFAMFGSPAGTWIPLGLIFAASMLAAALLSRPAGRRDLLGWVPTPEEQVEPLPGDDLLSLGSLATHAITIAAPPSSVWPWLAQMGFGRAGWYSHDRLDNAGHPSAEQIRVEWQAIAVGDPIPSSPGGRTYFEIMDLREPAHLVYGFHMVWPFRSGRWAEPSTGFDQRAIWTFVLRPVGHGAARLLARSRGKAQPGWLWAPSTAFFWLAHIVMQRKQLLEIRRRAEQAAAVVPS